MKKINHWLDTEWRYLFSYDTETQIVSQFGPAKNRYAIDVMHHCGHGHLLMKMCLPNIHSLDYLIPKRFALLSIMTGEKCSQPREH